MLKYPFVKLDYKMSKCYDDEDGDVDTKPTFWPTWAPKETLSKLLSTSLKLGYLSKPENYNCKGMSLQLNKQLLR